jgi:hypothetical protein
VESGNTSLSEMEKTLETPTAAELMPCRGLTSSVVQPPVALRHQTAFGSVTVGYIYRLDKEVARRTGTARAYSSEQEIEIELLHHSTSDPESAHVRVEATTTVIPTGQTPSMLKHLPLYEVHGDGLRSVMCLNVSNRGDATCAACALLETERSVMKRLQRLAVGRDTGGVGAAEQQQASTPPSKYTRHSYLTPIEVVLRLRDTIKSRKSCSLATRACNAT